SPATAKTPRSLGTGCPQPRALFVEIGAQRRDCQSPQGHHALLAALAEILQKPSLKVQILLLEADDFRRPRPGRVKRLQNRPVTQVESITRQRGVQQPRDGLRTEHLRDTLPQRRRAEQVDGTVADALLQAQEPV